MPGAIGEEDLGGRFWLKLVGGLIALGIAGILLFSLIGFAWYAWGAFGSLLFVFAVVLGGAYIYDRSHAKPYDDASM